MKSKRRKKYNKFWTGSGKFFLVLLVFYLLYFAISKIVKNENQKKYVYKKSEIELTGNHIISDREVINICGFSQNKDKEIQINPEQIAQDLMSLYYIKGVSIKDRPPRKINITLEERRPIAFIYGAGLNLIDEEGYLMPVPKAKIVWDLPLISGIKQKLGTLGKPANASQVYKALELIANLEMENPLLLGFISEINMHHDNYIELRLVRGGAKIRINTGVFQKELFVLKNYLVNYIDWADLHKIEYIDLRFKNQLVVKYRA